MRNGIELPIFFKPVLMEKVWGGHRIANFGPEKRAERGKIIGESWELVDRPEAQSVAIGGHWDGQTLREILEKDPVAILGPKLAAAKPARFPLLAKYVDAGQALSVQVHPNDEGARYLKDHGKSECWIVVHAGVDSRIIRGLRPGVTRADYERAVDKQCVEDVLHSFQPKSGDVIALPPGTVHAIGAGILVAEIQQNSDVTFRIYDYNRVGLDGKPRPLHVKEALKSIRFEKYVDDDFTGFMDTDTVMPLAVLGQSDGEIEKLLNGKFFDLHRYRLEPGGITGLASHPQAPRVLMAVEGKGLLGDRELSAGQTVLLPASAAPVELRAQPRSRLTVVVSAPTIAAC
jgi:mannose-6-phosphate isomerase